jgi:hypothetical protein
MQESLVRVDRIVRLLARCRRGNVAVEFATTLPVVVLFAFGAIDYGGAYVEGLRLTGAARAGVQQVLYDPVSWNDTERVERAALEEYVGHPLTDEEVSSLPVSAAADSFCACTAGVALDCSVTCPDGSSPGRFMRVNLSRGRPLLLSYPWSDTDSVNLAGEAVARVR